MSLHLSRRERRAARALIGLLRRRGWPPLLRADLFGSKARGDFDGGSDVDLLLLCDVAREERSAAGEANERLAERVGARTGVRLETWTICPDDLRHGHRTPMLVDAVADSVPLWPETAPPLRAPFTPGDAVFCAGRLLAWVDEGGAVARRALQAGRVEEAAARARDDIARLATAALLLTGDTRHRRRGSLRRFQRRFLRSGLLSSRARQALAWAAAAYPPDGGRGRALAPVTARAAATALQGCLLAAELESVLLPPLLDRMAELRRSRPT